MANSGSFSVLWGDYDDRANPLIYALEPAGPTGTQLSLMLKGNALTLLPTLVGFAGIGVWQGSRCVRRDGNGKSFDLLCLLCAIPYLLTIVIVTVLGLRARGDWTAPIFTLLPVALAGCLGAPTKQMQSALMWLCIVAIIAIPLGAPLRLYWDFRQRSPWAVRSDAEIARHAALVWRAGTGRPVGIVDGDLHLSVTAALELPERPQFHGYRHTVAVDAIEQFGVLFLCRTNDETCRARASAEVPQGFVCRLQTRRVMWDQQGPEYQTDAYIAPPTIVVLDQVAAIAACQIASTHPVSTSAHTQ